MVPVFLDVHVCRTVDRVVGHPQPSLSGIGAPWVSLPGYPLMCLDARGWHQGEASTLRGCWSVVLSMSRGGPPNKLNVVSLHCFCTRFVFRVLQQLLIHGHWNVRILTPLLEE